jgi:hypothetical protein
MSEQRKAMDRAQGIASSQGGGRLIDKLTAHYTSK